MSIITLTTDFGAGSPYIAAMKGVILSINPEVTLVDITHDVPAQNVRQGAIVVAEVTPWFPPGTIHTIVVDPGVGTQRAIIHTRVKHHDYIAPDNGVLSRLTQGTSPSKIIKLTNPDYWLPKVSATFHGRDIMAPVAAHLSLGLEPSLLGPPLESPADVDLPEPTITVDRIEGVVLEIDSFGNLITNIRAELLLGGPTDERLCVACGIYETWGLFRVYADQPRGTFISLIGSHGRLEMAVVGDSAASRLGLAVGSPVAVAWE